MAFALNSSTERAFERAKELLRKERALTKAECDELEELFDEVNGTQFMALTQDPSHARALREYDRHVWRPAQTIIIALVGLFVISVIMGFYVSLHR